MYKTVGSSMPRYRGKVLGICHLTTMNEKLHQHRLLLGLRSYTCWYRDTLRIKSKKAQLEPSRYSRTSCESSSIAWFSSVYRCTCDGFGTTLEHCVSSDAPYEMHSIAGQVKTTSSSSTKFAKSYHAFRYSEDPSTSCSQYSSLCL